MPSLKLPPFGGIAPKIAARLLPDGSAQIAENAKLFSGELDVFRAPKPVVDLTKGAGVKSVYRMIKANGEDAWLNWKTDVDAVRGPIAGDETQRTYYTGDNEPRVTDLALATIGGDIPYSWYVMGVAPPITAPTVSHSGGSGAAVSRSFVYTYVTEWGEESQPSPASAPYTGKIDGTWDISAMDVVPLNAFTMTGGTWSGGTATVQVASTFGLRVGEAITITGATPSGYNSSLPVLITALDATHISYAVATNPGAWSSGGTVNRNAPHHTNGLVKRIYWTQTVSGETVFQFVKEIGASSASTTVAGNATVGEPIPSSEYEMPPVDMKGLIELPNGVMAGFRGNEVLFSEPFIPHAWPTRYRLSTSRDVVGLGVSESSLVVVTKGVPYVISGAHPESMSMVRVNGQWPGASKRSIAGGRDGVKYACLDGIVLVGPGGSGIATMQVLGRSEFENFYPETIFAAVHQERYFAWYMNSDNVMKGFIFDTTGAGAVLCEIAEGAEGVWVDPETGDMYIISAGVLYKWDASDINTLGYDWKSKVYVSPSQVNWAAAKVEADYSNLVTPPPPATEDNAEYDFNVALLATSETWPGEGKTLGEMNGMILNDVAPIDGSKLKYDAVKAGEIEVVDSRFLTFRLYSDGVLKFSKNVTNNKPFRLPGGYTGIDTEIRLSGNIRSRYVEVGTSMEALGQQ